MSNGKPLVLTGKVEDKCHIPDESSKEDPPSEFHVIKVRLNSPVGEDEVVEVRVSSSFFDRLWKGSDVNLEYYPSDEKYVFIS